MLPQHALCIVAALWLALAPAARAQTSAQRPYVVDTWNTDDGLPPTSVNAVLQTRDGWYPTLIGVAVIDPGTTRQNIAPAVTVERIEVDGKPVSPAAPGTGLRVGPGASDVELSFAGLSLNTPNAVTFRYKLEGWDVNWIDAGTRRTAYYSRLAPGKYRFQVMAANRDGVWSPATTLALEVLPRFWQTVWFRILGTLVLAVSGIVFYRLRVRQVQAAAEASQRESTQRRIAAILESITNGFVALDDDWKFTYVNQAAEELLRKPRAELIGRNIWDSFPRAHENIIGVSLRRVAAERIPLTFEAPDVPGYGRWIEVHANPADEGISVYFSDITTRKQAEETLRSQSLRDELTGVFNRRGFSAHAEQHTRAAHRSGQGFHIVFIDMDGMKQINDTLGHPAGDQALLDVVKLLRRTFREADVIGRLGGDEFAVLAVESTASSIERVCERLRHNLDRHNGHAHRPYALSLSIGVSRYDPLEPLPIEELIDLADQRMYQEKRARKAQRV